LVVVESVGVGEGVRVGVGVGLGETVVELNMPVPPTISFVWASWTSTTGLSWEALV